MVLKVHHLGLSQSERIVLLCEELGTPYELVLHKRDPMLSPPSLTSLPGNEFGKAPFIQDTDANVALSESGAIVEYILARHKATTGAKTTLAKEYGDKDYVDYVYWFHWVNANLQPANSTNMFFGLSTAPADDPARDWVKKRLHGVLAHVDARLGQSKWLAGDDFTAADVMAVYSLTTTRYWCSVGSLAPYGNILRFLSDVGKREAYRRAMDKAEPETELLLGAEGPEKGLALLGGVQADIWRKKKA